MFKLFQYRGVSSEAGIFRQIPLNVKGRLYVSPMPFGAYDTRNQLMGLYREYKIEHVYIIATDDEIKRKARRDIRGDYQKIGATFRQLPIQDMTAPDLQSIREIVMDAVMRLQKNRIAIHCHAGVGRTSVLTCCVVQAVQQLAPDDSIAYVKKHMEVNMTSEQMSAVRRFRTAQDEAPEQA